MVNYCFKHLAHIQGRLFCRPNSSLLWRVALSAIFKSALSTALSDGHLQVAYPGKPPRSHRCCSLDVRVYIAVERSKKMVQSLDSTFFSSRLSTSVLAPLDAISIRFAKSLPQVTDAELLFALVPCSSLHLMLSGSPVNPPPSTDRAHGC